MSLPRKILEQCRLCSAKSWSNTDFAVRDHTALVLCPAKSRILCSSPREITEQCRLCSANLWRHSFRVQKNSSNLVFCSFCLIFFCKSFSFPRSFQPFGPLVKEKIFCVKVPLTLSAGDTVWPYKRSVRKLVTNTHK